jgi:hypothetical protein
MTNRKPYKNQTNNPFRFRTYRSVSKQRTLTSAECADTSTVSKKKRPKAFAFCT